jgi:hypothetical protein
MLDKPIKKCYDEGTILNDRSVLIMKKAFILVICCLLVVGCLLGCSITPKEQRVLLTSSGGFYHTLGDIDELPVGIYSVQFFFTNAGAESKRIPMWLIVEDDGDLKLLEPTTNQCSSIKIKND